MTRGSVRDRQTRASAFHRFTSATHAGFCSSKALRFLSESSRLYRRTRRLSSAWLSRAQVPCARKRAAGNDIERGTERRESAIWTYGGDGDLGELFEGFCDGNEGIGHEVVAGQAGSGRGCVTGCRDGRSSSS